MDMRNVVVTGAAGGVGSAIVMRLVNDGWTVYAIDVNEERLSKVASLHGNSVRPVLCDLTDFATVGSSVSEILREAGEVDALVNAVGWVQSTRFLEETPDYWDRLIAVNFKSLLHITHPLLKAMTAAKKGVIVNISSDAALVGTSGEAVYSGLKAAILAFGKSIARETARYGIRVNSICPGPTDTELLRDYKEGQPELFDRMVKQIPLRRVAQPEDIAGAVAFLLSPDASYLTGQRLSVSGGLTMI